jgi:hypothetical protein
MRYVGYVAYLEEKGASYRVLLGKLRERDHLQNPSIDGKILLKLIFKT